VEWVVDVLLGQSAVLGQCVDCYHYGDFNQSVCGVSWGDPRGCFRLVGVGQNSLLDRAVIPTLKD
jgi:hypothetical protein